MDGGDACPFRRNRKAQPRRARRHQQPEELKQEITIFPIPGLWFAQS